VVGGHSDGHTNWLLAVHSDGHGSGSLHLGLLPVSHSVCNAPKPMLMFLSGLHMKQVEVDLEMKQWPKSSKLSEYQFILLFLWMLTKIYAFIPLQL